MKWLVSDLFINKLFRLGFEIFIFRCKRKSKKGFFSALVGKPSHKKGYKPLKYKPFTYQQPSAICHKPLCHQVSFHWANTVHQPPTNNLPTNVQPTDWPLTTNHQPTNHQTTTANHSFTNHCPPIYWLPIYQIWKQWLVDIMLFSLDLKLFIIISKWNEYLINFSSYLMILLHHLASFKIVNSSNVILK